MFLQEKFNHKVVGFLGSSVVIIVK